MAIRKRGQTTGIVAPLAGSVDRNRPCRVSRMVPEESLPSRGAWIEIALCYLVEHDRRSRSPRGERG